MAGHTYWVNYVATSLFSLTGIIVSKGNHPQMAARFRLVKYYNLPRYMHSHRIIKKACNERETVWTWEVIPIDGRIMSFLLFMVAWHNIHPIWMRDVPFQSDGLATLVSSRNSVHQSEFANVLSHVPPYRKRLCVIRIWGWMQIDGKYHAALRKSSAGFQNNSICVEYLDPFDFQQNDCGLWYSVVRCSKPDAINHHQPPFLIFFWVSRWDCSVGWWLSASF